MKQVTLTFIIFILCTFLTLNVHSYLGHEEDQCKAPKDPVIETLQENMRILMFGSPNIGYNSTRMNMIEDILEQIEYRLQQREIFCECD